jgi:hypothetical protein
VNFSFFEKTLPHKRDNAMLKTSSILLVLLAVGLTGMNRAEAHFPFLAPDGEGNVVMFFGENLADRSYHLPAAIENSKLIRVGSNQSRQELDSKKVDSEKFVGLVAPVKLQSGDLVAAHATYGIYHGSRLDYYCVYLSAIEPSDSPTTVQTDHPLVARLSENAEGVQVEIRWHGEPVSGASVSLSDKDGQARVQGKTNREGQMTLSLKDLESGLNALVIGHKVEGAGELDGEKYDKASHYLTVTFENRR